MIEIDYQLLSPEILENVLAEIVLTEGTDYGFVEVPFEIKKQQLREKLEMGQARIVYDSKMNHCDVVPIE